jgi:hypothetical protein
MGLRGKKPKLGNAGIVKLHRLRGKACICTQTWDEKPEGFEPYTYKQLAAAMNMSISSVSDNLKRPCPEAPKELILTSRMFNEITGNRVHQSQINDEWRQAKREAIDQIAHRLQKLRTLPDTYTIIEKTKNATGGVTIRKIEKPLDHAKILKEEVACYATLARYDPALTGYPVEPDNPMPNVHLHVNQQTNVGVQVNDDRRGEIREGIRSLPPEQKRILSTLLKQKRISEE